MAEATDIRRPSPPPQRVRWRLPLFYQIRSIGCVVATLMTSQPTITTMQVPIKEAESLSELVSYIDKIERIDINSDNFKDHLKEDFREQYEHARLGKAVDILYSARMQRDMMWVMRQELFRQAVILRGRFDIPIPVPQMTGDAHADISVWLRQWCTEGLKYSTTDRKARTATRSLARKAKMQTTNHFHGPVGAVQNGTDNTAHVQQHVGHDLAGIMQLLEVCHSELENEPNEVNRKEAADLLDDLREEIQKQSPKKSRVLAYIKGLSTLASAGTGLATAVAKLYPLVEHLHLHH